MAIRCMGCSLRKMSGGSTWSRGFALLTTMLLITLLVAGMVELATVTSTQAVVTARRSRTLAHELAVDSALVVLADRLNESDQRLPELIEQLDRDRQAAARFSIGEVAVECTLRDDAAKFNPLLFAKPHQQVQLVRKLDTLAVRKSLPSAQVTLRPIVVESSSESQPLYRWFDQILHSVEPGALFNWDENSGVESRPVWSDVLTFWGDGRIDLRRVDVVLLEAALSDIRPGLARQMLSVRPKDRALDFTRTALIKVHAEIRQRVAARLTFDARRYAIRMDTSIGPDRRRWYVVAEMDPDKLNVLHRSQLTW